MKTDIRIDDVTIRIVPVHAPRDPDNVLLWVHECRKRRMETGEYRSEPVLLAPVCLHFLDAKTDKCKMDVELAAWKCCRYIVVAGFADGAFSEDDLDAIVEVVGRHWKLGGGDIGIRQDVVVREQPEEHTESE